MAFNEVRKVYRPINGQELKDILPKRVAEAMLHDNVVNVARAFPLVSYKVHVEIQPYQLAGKDAQGNPIAHPDARAICYDVEGELFVPVYESTVELVEQSPIYGSEADPQDLRRMGEVPVIDSARTEIGELVDVKLPVPRKARETSEAPDAPAVIVIPGDPAYVPADAPPSPGEDPKVTYAVEEERWKRSRGDKQVDAAVESRDPSLAPGRVSVITSVAEGGGQDHGRGRRRP